MNKLGREAAEGCLAINHLVDIIPTNLHGLLILSDNHVNIPAGVQTTL